MSGSPVRRPALNHQFTSVHGLEQTETGRDDVGGDPHRDNMVISVKVDD